MAGSTNNEKAVRFQKIVHLYQDDCAQAAKGRPRKRTSESHSRATKEELETVWTFGSSIVEYLDVGTVRSPC
jgi:hypothetical protein